MTFIDTLRDIEDIETEDGGVEVELDDEFVEDEEIVNEFDVGGHYENLVTLFTDSELNEIAMEVIEGYTSDKEARAEWDENVVQGIENLGLEYEELNEPFEGACAARHPLILENAVKFQSKASNELLPAKGPADVLILGDVTEDKVKQASRVKNHLNYQVTKQMPEFYPDTEELFLNIALIGSGIKKTYFDFREQRPCSEFIPIDQFYVSPLAKDLRRAERYTHVIYRTPKELSRDFEAQLYLEPLELGTPSQREHSEIHSTIQEIQGIQDSRGEDDEVYTLLEQHTYLDLFDEGIFRPYVITVDQDSMNILSIRRNWRPNDPTETKREWFTRYLFVPGFGFYGLGFIQLLGNFQNTLTLVMRSLADSGQFANLQGGFKAKGMRVEDDDRAIAPGEWRDVETTGLELQKALMPLPYKEPSQTLFAMLEYLEARGQKFADTTEQVVNDSTNYGKVGTTMALLEAATKFYSAIHKRLHKSLGQELSIIAELNYDFLPDEYPYDVPGESRNVFREDYDPNTVDVVPVSDPNIHSSTQRMLKAQQILQAAMQAPQIHNLKEAYRNFYRTVEVDNVDDLLPPDDQAVPQDPLTDLLSAVRGKPIAAFPGQNHKAHLQVKMAWVADPTQGASETMAQVTPIVLANIREHQLMEYQEQIQGQLGAQGIQGAALDPRTLEMVIGEAAQQASELNRMHAEELAEGGPAGILAKAEMLKAQTDSFKEQREAVHQKFEEGAKLIELSLKAEDLKNKAFEIKRKTDLESVKVGADIILQGLERMTEGAKKSEKSSTKSTKNTKKASKK